MDGVIEDVEFLVRSEARMQILKELMEAKKATKTDLRQHLECSRTTVQRNLDALVEQDYVSKTNQTYSLRAGTTYIADELFSLIETIEVARDLQPFLRWMDPEKLDLDLRELRDAQLWLPKDGDPYAMINQQVSRLKTAETASALLPFTGLHATEVAHERVIEHGAEMEAVVETEVAETFLNDPQYEKFMKDLVETERFDLFRYDGTLPVSLVIIDDAVQMIADEDDQPRAMIETDTDSVREWAQQTYREYKTRATEVTCSE